MSIVSSTDFTGEYSISNTVYSSLSLYIDKFEKIYLTKLFGAELYSLFIADLTPTSPQTPQTQRFIDVFNFFDTDDGVSLITSEGIKAMLVQFIYFHFVRDLNYQQTDTGVVRRKSELGELINYKGFNLDQSYNEGVCNFNAIQWFINENIITYPEFNGVELEYKGYL